MCVRFSLAVSGVSSFVPHLGSPSYHRESPASQIEVNGENRAGHPKGGDSWLAAAVHGG
jgi:hypothetical protein